MVYKENWKNNLEQERLMAINLINKLKENQKGITMKKEIILEGVDSIDICFKIHLFENYIEEFLKEEVKVEDRKIIDYTTLQEGIWGILNC